MKVRKGFVTNSSSSSFVIGKKDDTSVSIESVYQIVRESFIKTYITFEQVKAYIENDPRLKISIKETEKNIYFKSEIDYRHFENVRNEIIKLYNFDIYNLIPKNSSWVNCKSYEDYVNYWNSKNECGPFTIIDFFETKKVKWVHFNGEEEYKVDTTNEILNWYFPYMEENGKCNECCFYGSCDKEECMETQMLKRNNLHDKEKACLYFLGRVCICSECGYIPAPVVDNLSEISEYWCNHMG